MHVIIFEKMHRFVLDACFLLVIVFGMHTFLLDAGIHRKPINNPTIPTGRPHRQVAQIVDLRDLAVWATCTSRGS